MNDVLLIKCFGRWWFYDQKPFDDPPKIPQDILELADIVYYPAHQRTIKNRYRETFEDAIRLRFWVNGEDVPSVDDITFRHAYVDYISALNQRLNM